MKKPTPKSHVSRKSVLLPLAMMLVTPFAATSCVFGPEIVGIHMSDSSVLPITYGNFSYEDINVTVDYRDGSYKEIPLTEEMISPVEQMKFFKLGPQEIEVVYRSRFKTTMPVEVVYNQFKDSYALVGYECTYDGQPHEVKLNQELPEGATISYPYGNIFTNAGVYEVVGVMSKNGYATKTLTTTLTINQAKRAEEDIVFNHATLIYNGEQRSIEAKNVPEGVEVSYETYDYDLDIRINKVVNAGKYRVVAHFTDTSPNYAKIEDKEAILTIERARFDMRGVSFEDVKKQYDGQPYEASITNPSALPKEVSVDYSYFDEQGNPVPHPVTVGTYKMVATFTHGYLDNYYPIEPMEATLTVTQAVIKISDKIRFDSPSYAFDENKTYTIAITGELPEGVEVEYENNGKHYAGEYKVIANFKATDPNYTVDVEQMTAILVITRVRRSVMSFDPATGKYDKEFSEANIQVKDGQAEIIDIDFETFRVVSLTFYSKVTEEKVSPADFVDGTTYKYVGVFEYLDPQMNDSVILSEASDDFTYHAEVTP